MKKIGIEEIANQLGVSKTLVSLVLNGKAKDNRIGEEIASKVIALAQELNYKPNHFARGLRKGTTNTIGLVISDISNPFFAKIARFVEDEAAKANYQVIIGSSDEKKEKTEELIHLLLDKKVDGLIITPNQQNSKILLELKKQQVPFVLVDRHLPKVKANYVGTQNSEGIVIAVNHLAKQQYEKIALITYEPLLSNIRERITGFKAAIKENKLKLHNHYVQEVSYNNTLKDVQNAIDELLGLNQVPRAIIFATNKIGLYGLEYLREKGIRIPQDISVISFDDDPAFRLSYPPVTVIEQSLEDIAVQATKLLIKNIRSKEKPNEVQITKPTKLIIRQS